jgi:hypothetical protein
MVLVFGQLPGTVVSLKLTTSPAHLKRADPTQLQATLAQSEVPDDVSVVVIYPGGMLLHNAEMRQIAVSWAQQRFPEAVLMAVGPDALSVSGAAYSVLHATDILDATSDEELREQLVEVRRRHDLESVLATEQQTLWWCSREEKGDAFGKQNWFVFVRHTCITGKWLGNRKSKMRTYN